MFDHYRNYFGIIATIFIVLYTLKYILTDVYAFIKNNSIKAKINNLLPFLNKYNNLFILIALLFSSFHFYLNYHYTSLLNPGYLTIFLIISLVITILFKKKFIKYKQYIITLPYLLLISLFVHIFFR